ncbi:breakpoint cluster region protein-like [Cololabis saira]|uniref:breakpoint cluster region protein-like n=1 Tax=Cololabis saira TaxID=129043 RepID=UPI002AD3C47F|nr:breakpoint cluster region protein-like [Cololabis saira]
MDLNSVEDVESELEACKAKLKGLQKALAEEKFKVIYLQTTVARRRKDENFNAETFGFSKTGGPRKPQRRDDEGGGSSGSRDPGGVKPSPAGGGSFGRERGRFSGRTGIPVPIPVPPAPKGGFHSTDNKVPAIVTHANDNDKSSDREYEDAELNHNFVRNNLLTPKSVGGDGQRTFNLHRDNRRMFRHSRDLDSCEEGRQSPSFPQTQLRASQGSRCSTPDRKSDGYLSSDHDDDSSAGKVFMKTSDLTLHFTCAICDSDFNT